MSRHYKIYPTLKKNGWPFNVRNKTKSWKITYVTAALLCVELADPINRFNEVIRFNQTIVNCVFDVAYNTTNSKTLARGKNTREPHVDLIW